AFRPQGSAHQERRSRQICGLARNGDLLLRRADDADGEGHAGIVRQGRLSAVSRTDQALPRGGLQTDLNAAGQAAPGIVSLESSGMPFRVAACVVAPAV